MRSGRFLTGALLVAVGVFALLSATTFVADTWRHLVDSSIYLLCAKSMAAGEGYTYLDKPFFVRPPGISWLLSQFMDGEPLTHETPGSGWDFRLYHQVIQICVGLTIVTVLLALKRLHGWRMAAIVTLLFAVNPLTLATQNTVLAEFPFMALFFAGAWLLSDDRSDDPDGHGPGQTPGRTPGWAPSLLGALCIGASLYFRTVGVLFLPGLVLAGLGRRPRWRGLVLTGVVVLAVLPWQLHSADARAQADSPSTQLLMFDYTTAMFRENPSDPSSPIVGPEGWWIRLQENLDHIGESLDHVFLGAEPSVGPYFVPSPGAWVLMALLAVAMTFTWWRRRSALDWYMMAYAALLLSYFTYTDRLLLPMLPMMLSAIVYSATALGRRLSLNVDAEPGAFLGAVTAALIFVIGLWCLPASRAIIESRQAFYYTDFVTAEWILENTEPSDQLLHEKGAIFTVLTGRTTYTHRNLPGPWPEGCPEVDWALFRTRCVDEMLIGDVTDGFIRLKWEWQGPTGYDKGRVRIYEFKDEGEDD